jgi:hypothetical protein
MDADAQKLLAQQKEAALLVIQKKAARSELKKLIRQSKWDELKAIYPDFAPKLVEHHGQTYFDWTSMTAKMSLLFAGDEIPESPKKEKGIKGTYKAVAVPLAIVEKGIPLRILEGIGDRVIGFSAAIIGFDKFKTDCRGFHSLYQGLISNSNLGSAGYESGDAAEIELGCVFVMEGHEAAKEAGVKLLKQTSVYKQSCK